MKPKFDGNPEIVLSFVVAEQVTKRKVDCSLLLMMCLPIIWESQMRKEQNEKHEWPGKPLPVWDILLRLRLQFSDQNVEENQTELATAIRFHCWLNKCI